MSHIIVCKDEHEIDCQLILHDKTGDHNYPYMKEVNVRMEIQNKTSISVDG